jgi:3-hydroxyacyl-[acyl-carrier-protein] dehydratase
MDEIAQQTVPYALDISAILERLPHRFPLLLVDRVLEVHPGHRIRAVKNVTYNEPFFAGHFPSRPLMPGVIVLEALAQTASILYFMSASAGRRETARLQLVGFEKARFRQPVTPGDQLVLCAQFESNLKTMVRFLATAFVGENLVANAEIMMIEQA